MFPFIKIMAYTSKQKMLAAIHSANSRLYRVRHSGYTKGQKYLENISDIAKIAGVSPLSKTAPKTIKKRGTMKELKSSYELAKRILKQPEMTVKGIKTEMETKRVKTFAENMGVKLTKKNKRSFYNLLNSPEFSQLSEKFGSDVLLSTIVENKGKKSFTSIQETLENYMKDGSGKDRYYIEDLENVISE